MLLSIIIYNVNFILEVDSKAVNMTKARTDDKNQIMVSISLRTAMVYMLVWMLSVPQKPLCKGLVPQSC